MAVCLASVPVARTQGQQSLDPLSSVRAGSTITYLELLRRLFPDATYDTAKGAVRAEESIEIRSVVASDDPTDLDSDITISRISPTWMQSSGRLVLLLTIAVDAEDAHEATPYAGHTTILGAFDISTGPRLIDAIDVQTDRFADTWDKQTLLRLSNGDDAVIIHNTHWNAGESYDKYTLLFVDHGKFSVISDITLFSTQGCGVSYAETPSYAANPHAGRPFSDIKLRVTLKKAADGRECDHRTPGFTHMYTATYTWDVKKHSYIGNLHGLAPLDKFNNDRLH